MKTITTINDPEKQSIFYQNLQRAINAKIVIFDKEKGKITYLAVEQKTHNYKDPERERNIIADITVKYGKEPKYIFVKGFEGKNLKKVS